MPKFAVMTFMFGGWWRDGRLTHSEMLKHFAAAGVEGIEPFHRDFVDNRELLQLYRAMPSDYGMTVAAVDVMCNLVYSNAAERQEGLDDMRRGLDVCAKLDTDIIHVAGHRLREGVSPEDGRKMIADGLMEAVSFADEQGMTVAIEDFNPAPDLICSAEDCLDLLKLTGDKVQFVFDTGNFLAVEEESDTVIDQFAGRICHCHFKDYERMPDPPGYRSADLGAGVIPNQAVAKKLVQQGYDGWVALETRSRNDMCPTEAVRTELPLLKSWFAGG